MTDYQQGYCDALEAVAKLCRGNSYPVTYEGYQVNPMAELHNKIIKLRSKVKT